MSGAYFSVQNYQMMYLLVRPMYWFGVGQTASLNTQLSVANVPVYTNGGKTVTIKMKGFKWSNGETVNAQDVVFWSNLMKANATSWAAYAPGPNQYPGNIVNVTANNSTDTVTFVLNKPYSSLWYTYNELSQITPLPIAWDIKAAGGAPGSGGCSSAAYTSVTTATQTINGTPTLVPVSAAAKNCAAVLAFMTGKTEAGDLGTYATNPLWQIVDGPFRLTTYDATDGGATLVPNTKYSGTPKPSIDKLVMAPFTTDSAEYDVLASGGNKINLGYVPPQNLPPYKGRPWCGTAPCVGGNAKALASNYTLAPVLGWGYSYFALNYTNPTTGPIFKQLYVRQAFQSLQNQPLWTQLYDAGYGAPTLGPVPAYPPSSFVSSNEKTVLYPYDPAKAVSLLKSHGWTVVPNGVSTCTDPGTGASQCGAGIPKGAPMSFNFLYSTGVVSFENQIKEQQTTWEQAGIKLTVAGKSFGDVISTAFSPCTAGKTCPWEMADWGAGWIYSPDFYPTGEELYACGAGSNSGQYCDTKATNLIEATNTSSSVQALYAYENYLAVQLPSIWQPLAASAYNEIGKNVCGVQPQNILLQWPAEFWYFCKPSS